MMKKFLCFMLSAILLFGICPTGTVVFAADSETPTRLSQASKWDGTVYSVASAAAVYTFAGEGTEDSPYLLQSAEDVAKLAANVNFIGADTSYNGQYFRLTCDLNLDNKEWVGIGFGGSDSNRFEGIFDGDGHVVYNFNLKPAQYNGFFGYVGNGAVIRNFGLANGEVYLGSGRSSTLIAFSKLNVTVSNCFSRVKVNYSGNGHVGGMIGAMMNDGNAVRVIENCYCSGDVIITNASKNYAIGGIAGSITDGSATITNCYYTGNISVTASTNGLDYTDLYQHSVGGLVGAHSWPGTYTYRSCQVGGSIAYANKNAEYPLNLGSMVGFIHQSSTVTFGDGNETSLSTIANIIGGGYAVQPDNIAAKDVIAVPFANGSRYFIQPVVSDISNPLPGGEPEEGGEDEEPEELVLPTPPAEKPLFTPANEAERARYEAASKWDGTVYHILSEDEIYTFEGDGTKSSPYLLKSADDLAKFAANVRFSNEATTYLGKYFKLTCDLDFRNFGWWGIGGCKTTIAWDDNNMFAGSFDGDGHVIYNFNLADKAEDGKQLLFNGLFGYAGYGSIENIGIVNGEIWLNSASRTAALIGASRYDIVVSNCFNQSNMTFLFNETGEPRVGGLMGAVMNNNYTERTIENCYNSGNITVYAKGVSEHAVGGLVGYLSDGTGNFFKNCYNTGDIRVYADHGKLGSTDYFKLGIGSLVGSFAWKASYSFENCGAGGSITYTNATANNTVLIGAFVGYIREASTLKMGSGNTYSVAVDGDVIAGGWNNSAIQMPQKVENITIPLAEGELYFIKPAVKENPPVENPPVINPPVTNPPDSDTTDQPSGTKPPVNSDTQASGSGNEAQSGCSSALTTGVLGMMLAIAAAGGVCLRRKKED